VLVERGRRRRPCSHCSHRQRLRAIIGRRAVTTEALKVPARSEGDLDAVESALGELLRCYRDALRYAGDMPLIGRSRVNGRWFGRWGWHGRWGSRLLTRVYVETHVRKQLQAIRDCLRLELVGRTEEADRQRVTALEQELERHLEPLFRWRRLTGLLARLPPVAAALPVLSAATAWPLADDVSLRTVVDAALVLAGTALALWILVVWPSIRLGFRVKRVIFRGGKDLRHPFWWDPGEVEWTGFPAPAFADDYDPAEHPYARNRRREACRAPRQFPAANVYKAENRVFRALGRRKPAEVPIDLLLSFVPYISIALTVFLVYALLEVVSERGLWQTTTDSPLGLVVVAGLAALTVATLRHARNTYHDRPH
jgi:hypothetical protein